MPSDFFEKLPKRLDTRSNCDCGLLFGQMVPITINFVAEKKGADKYVPRNEAKQDIVFKNLCFSNGDNIPEDVKSNFQKCQYLMRRFGMSSFENKDFQNSYKIVANRIFEETLKLKDKKLEFIHEKAQGYLDRYRMFYEQVVCKRSKNFNIKMPETFTRLNKLVRYLHGQNEAVKMSLQNAIADKYGLTEEQYDIAKKFAEKFDKPLEQVIRSNIAFAPDSHYDGLIKSNVIAEEAVKRKQQNITQERNNSKLQPITVKPNKKDTDYNCR